MYLIKCLPMVLLISVHLCMAQIKTIQLTDDAINERLSTPDLHFSPGTYFTAGGKYLAFFAKIQADDYLRVWEKDDQGMYTIEHAVRISNPVVFITTNGRWFGSIGMAPTVIRTFRQNPIGDLEEMAVFASEAQFMQFLSDDNLVLISTSFIETYEFVNGSWSKIQHQNVSFQVTLYFDLLFPKPTDSQPHLTDTTLAAFNPTTNNVELYTRNENKSWTLVDQVPIITTMYRANRIIWNGGNDLILAHTSRIIFIGADRYVSRLLLYLKESNGWLLNQITDNGMATQNIGFSMLLINHDLIAVGVPVMLEGGEVQYLRRMDEGSWQIIARFQNPTLAYFGTNLQQNDDGIFIFGVNATGTVSKALIIPPCYRPIIYSCSNVVLDDCSDGFKVPYNQLYSIGDPCTTLNFDSLQSNGKSTTLSLRFTSELFGSVSCDAKVSCNATIPCENSPAVVSETNSTVPIVSPSSAAPPVTSVNPITAPHGNASPLSVIPVASPISENKVTSASGQRLVNAVQAIGCFFVWLFV